MSTQLTKTDSGLWLARIDAAGKHFKENFYEKAKKLRKFYKGEHFPDSMADYTTVINYCFSIVKAILPQVYYQDPYLFITAADETTDTESVSAAEAILNYFWLKAKTKRQIKKVVLDAMIYGYGILKQGYHTKTVKNDVTETAADYTELIEEEYPYSIRTSPLDVVFDTSHTDLDYKRWIACKYYLPLSEVKKKYNNTSNIKGDFTSLASSRDIEDLKIGKKYHDDFKMVKLWEVQDLVEGMIYVVCEEEEGKYLRKEECPYEIPGGNYRFLMFNEVPDEIFPLSDLSQIKDLNMELNKTRSQLLNHRAKSQRKIFYEEGIFANDKAKKDFLNEDDMVSVALRDGRLKDGVQLFNPQMVDANLYNIDLVLRDDINNVSAVGYQQRAAESPTEKTATEAHILDRNANLRNSERLDAVSDFCVDAARGMLKILQEYLTDEVAVKVAQKGDDRWEKFNKDSIKGEFNIRIDVGATAKPNTGEDRAMIAEFAQTALGLQRPDGSPVINHEGLAKVLAEKYRFTEEEIEKMLGEVEKEEEKPPEEPPQEGEPSPEEMAQILAMMGGGQGMPPGAPPMGMAPQPQPAPEPTLEELLMMGGGY